MSNTPKIFINTHKKENFMTLRSLYEMAMRKVGGDTSELVKNKLSGKPSKNTEVIYNQSTGVSQVLLHGNLIFEYDHKKKKFWFSNAQWNTVTTKSRLNDLFEDLSDIMGGRLWVVQRKGEWYVMDRDDNMKEFDSVAEQWYKSVKDIFK